MMTVRHESNKNKKKNEKKDGIYPKRTKTRISRKILYMSAP